MVKAITGKNAIATNRPMYLFRISGSAIPAVCVPRKRKHMRTCARTHTREDACASSYFK